MTIPEDEEPLRTVDVDYSAVEAVEEVVEIVDSVEVDGECEDELMLFVVVGEGFATWSGFTMLMTWTAPLMFSIIVNTRLSFISVKKVS